MWAVGILNRPKLGGRRPGLSTGAEPSACDREYWVILSGYVKIQVIFLSPQFAAEPETQSHRLRNIGPGSIEDAGPESSSY